jgi:hypothetical protein
MRVVVLLIVPSGQRGASGATSGVARVDLLPPPVQDEYVVRRRLRVSEIQMLF